VFAWRHYCSPLQSFEMRKTDQNRALPLGARIKLDPWAARIELVKTKAGRVTSATRRLPFEVTPFSLPDPDPQIRHRKMPSLLRNKRSRKTPGRFAQGVEFLGIVSRFSCRETPTRENTLWHWEPIKRTVPTQSQGDDCELSRHTPRFLPCSSDTTFFKNLTHVLPSSRTGAWRGI